MSVTYKICKIIRAVTGKKKPKTAALILAAGLGTRMKSDRTKQMIRLLGEPLFMKSVREFARSPYIDEIVIVCLREEINEVKHIVLPYNIEKIKAIVAGGSTRQLSALAGFESITPDCKFVAIHDAARACVTADMISDVVSAAYACGAASAVGKVVDTVKKIDSNGYISSTLDRNELVLAQTPQVFQCDLYRACAYTALKNGVSVTDDNMLAERIGHRIRAVDCTSENFKITTHDDIARAEAILMRREKEKKEKTDDKINNKSNEKTADRDGLKLKRARGRRV